MAFLPCFMPEDSSQTQHAASSEEFSQSNAATTPAAVATADTTLNPQSQPQSNAGSPSQGTDGTAGTGDATIDDYAAQKAAFLAQGVPSAEVPMVQTPEVLTQEPDDFTDVLTPPAEDGKFAPIKLRPKSAEGRQLMSEYKAAAAAGYDKDFSDYVLERKAPAPAPAPAVTPTDDATHLEYSDYSPAEFTSVDEVSVEVKRLRALQAEKNAEFDFAAAAEFQNAADDLLMRLPDIRDSLRQATASAAEQAAAAWADSQAKAKTVFPDAGVSGSALETAAAQVRANWIATNHPLANATDSALALYAEAAAQIGYAPQSSNPVASPAPVHRPALSPILGNFGVPAQPTQATRSVLETPLDDYEAEKAAFLGQRGVRAVA
jgi:hypothetical protein